MRRSTHGGRFPILPFHCHKGTKSAFADSTRTFTALPSAVLVPEYGISIHTLIDSRRYSRAKIISSFAERTRSAIYFRETDAKTLPPLEVFRLGRQEYPAAGDYWMNRMSALSMDVLRAGFAALPLERISPAAADFALALLEINRNGLLRLWEETR